MTVETSAFLVWCQKMSLNCFFAPLKFLFTTANGRVCYILLPLKQTFVESLLCTRRAPWIKQGMRSRVEDGGWRSTGKKQLDNNLITSLVSVPKIKYRGLWEFYVCESLSRVPLFVTPWTVGLQAPVSEILQARILKWVAIAFTRGSSPPRDRARVSALPVDSLPSEAPGKPCCCCCCC